jgi:hypothetical protein
VETDPRRPYRWSALILLLACWIVFPLGPLSWIMPFLLIWALWRAVSCRAIVTIAVISLANPLSFFFALGVKDYFSARPALHGMGLPGPEFGNLDRDTRCFHSTGGCVVSGDEWVHIVPHNLALRVATTVLGPPSGTYDGPYPTREEALAAFTPGTRVSLAEFRSGAIPTDSGLVRIDPAVAEKIVRFLMPLSGYALGEQGELFEDEQLSAALWRKRCLILRWRLSGALLIDGETAENVILIDVRTSKPFAVYQIQESGYLRRAAIGMFWR